MKFQEGLIRLKKRTDKFFLLTGPEEFLRDLFIRTASSMSGAVFSFDKSSKDAIQTMSCKSLMGTRTFIVRDIDVVSVLDSISDDIVVCVADDLKSKAVTGLLSKVIHVACEGFREYNDEYPNWISSTLFGSGCSFEDGVPDRVYQKVGPSLYTIANELEKLIIISNNKHITLKDVDDYVSLTAQASAFQILDYVLSRDKKKCLDAYDIYYNTYEDILDLVKFMCLYMEKMYRIQVLAEQKTDMSVIADIVGIHQFLLRTKYMPKLNMVGKTWVSNKFNDLCRLDIMVRHRYSEASYFISNFFFNL